jgi:hypothetical protein
MILTTSQKILLNDILLAAVRVSSLRPYKREDGSIVVPTGKTRLIETLKALSSRGFIAIIASTKSQHIVRVLRTA